MPRNEFIGKAFREERPLYTAIAIRELVQPERFLDFLPRSRNQALASLMRCATSTA
ncbi:MAG: hypothetical protein AB3X44_10540 [Leptothrix sp. (in: b-proteobacteria)]